MTSNSCGLPLTQRVRNAQALLGIVAYLWEANVLAYKKHHRKAKTIALKAIPLVDQMSDFDWRWSNGADFVKGALKGGYYYYLWSRLQGDLQEEVTLLTTNQGRFISDPKGLFHHKIVGGVRGFERWIERGNGDSFYIEALKFIAERLDGGVDTIGAQDMPGMWHWWIESVREETGMRIEKPAQPEG